MTEKRTYAVMQRLIKARLVLHERIFHAKPGVYRLTAQGAEGTGFLPLPRIALATYEHHSKLFGLYFTLRQRYPEAQWISERQLKQEKYQHGVGKVGHIADAMLLLPDKKPIAIELELTQKSQSRLESILKYYRSDFSIHEVWYFSPQPIYQRLQKMAEKMPHIKPYLLEEALL